MTAVRPLLSIIVAIADNNVIGGNNTLLWHISEDLRRFKAITSGHAVIMGRKTYESIGRPLPNRRNIIVTRQSGLRVEGCETAGSIEEAAAMCNGDTEIFIIGGGEIYRAAMPLADRLYITRVHHQYEGDTFFPAIGGEWRLVEEERHECGEKFQYPFSFETYERLK